MQPSHNLFSIEMSRLTKPFQYPQNFVVPLPECRYLECNKLGEPLESGALLIFRKHTGNLFNHSARDRVRDFHFPVHRTVRPKIPVGAQ